MGEVYPSAAESVYISTADAAVGYLDVDVCFLPGLGFKFAPLHLSLDGVLVVAEPSLEFVVGHCHWTLMLICRCCGLDRQVKAAR